jgi:hypothetical protein
MLSKYDIIHMRKKKEKGIAIVNHLADNVVNDERIMSQ